MANCIKCGKDICKYEYNGILFEICKGCASVIISKDNFEKLSNMIDTNCELIDLFQLKPVKTKENDKICHHCGHKMDKIYYDGVLLDRCNHCNLLFFDNGELSKYFAKFAEKEIDIMNNALFIKTFCSGAKQIEANEDKEESNSTVIVKESTKESDRMKIQAKETEKQAPYTDGWIMVGFELILFVISAIIFFGGGMVLGSMIAGFVGTLMMLLGAIIFFLALWLLGGFKIIRPQEAMVFTLFGKYYGSLKVPGFHWVNPFASIIGGSVVSLKARTLDNGKQKINDVMGNPIEVGIMVTWEVKDTAKAIFNVDNFPSFLSAQCDSALRNIVRMYPYDVPDGSEKQSLKGDSAEIAEKLKIEIQERVLVAGLNILDARITHLAYSSEIAIAMLQRQQANAVLDAKRTIVEGAVGMVEMAINRLSENKNIVLDDKTKASMVNNLLVVLCSSRESQPVIRNDIV